MNKYDEYCKMYESIGEHPDVADVRDITRLQHEMIVMLFNIVKSMDGKMQACPFVSIDGEDDD